MVQALKSVLTRAGAWRKVRTQQKSDPGMKRRYEAALVRSKEKSRSGRTSSTAHGKVHV